MDIDFTNHPHNLSSNEVILLVNKQFPNLKHGVDFWVAHNVAPNSPERVSPAVIVKWDSTSIEPTPAQLAAYEVTYADDIMVMREAEKRFDTYPVKTPLEFREWLVRIGQFPRSITKLIDEVDSDELNASLESYWEYTDWFRRDDPFTIWLASALEKTPVEFDTMWNE
ncbi:hypothetical protein [Agrobacterium tumefaciens]|uniref:XkdW family protein n=1 Tax=Agrobacterium tumefaciens TaxID=358 RepID=UPI001571878B|nr:hypothetical protein [Agrobacterium tumefaciens]WCJ63818.1 hypothetical protein G6M15_06385 [Agrobacterium tumefaciens]